MKALFYFVLFTCLISDVPAFAKAGDTIRIKTVQDDSLTKKVDYYMLKASLNSAKSPAEAVKCYRSALLTNKSTDDLWEANIRAEMGKLLTRLKNKEAIAQLAKAEALYRKEKSLYGRIDARLAVAKFYEATGSFAEAKKVYDALYKLQLDNGEAVLAGNTAYYLTNYYLKQKNLPEAFNYADKAKNAYYFVCRRDSLASIYYTIADIKKKQNKPKLAEYYLISQALPYFSASENLSGRLKTFNFLGNLYLEQKRLSEAKWFYIQANTQARALQDTSAIIRSLMQLTLVKVKIGDNQLAMDDLNEAAQIAEETKKYNSLVADFRLRNALLVSKLEKPVSAAAGLKPAKLKVTVKKTPAKKTADASSAIFAETSKLK